MTKSNLNDSLTFNQAYEALQALVKEFESDNLDLEAAISKYQKAADLSKFLQTKLDQLENQIKKIELP